MHWVFMCFNMRSLHIKLFLPIAISDYFLSNIWWTSQLANEKIQMIDKPTYDKLDPYVCLV